MLNKKKFTTNQFKILSKNTEFSLLQAIIEIAVEAENYELAQLVHNRIVSVRNDENQSRSYSMKSL